MNEKRVDTKPTLIVVTGRPGSGKTTLAHLLARTVRCPALCRDEFKEGFVNTTGRIGEPGDDIAWNLYEVFFATVESLLRHKITLVAEAAFQHKLWAPKLEALRETAEVRVIVCETEPVFARSRYIERGLTDPIRERFHHDRAVQAAREGRELPVGGYTPPSLELPTMSVDTTDGYRPGIEAIAAFACPDAVSRPPA